MTDLIIRPAAQPEVQPESLAERLLDTQAPQRPQAGPAFRIEVDGRVVEGHAGQTILEVCRDNGIEIPTLC
ncbi:MAG: 2Fe-2S iron-sulfur cluster-binding protein, partial [Chloroflexota bacterium]